MAAMLTMRSPLSLWSAGSPRRLGASRFGYQKEA
jgi:hypothetical protein